MGWVTDDGGAMDRVAIFCAVLLGACAVVMLVACIAWQAWLGVAVWLVVLALCGYVLVGVRRRARGAGHSRR